MVLSTNNQYSQLQPINVQESVNKPTVGAIHEFPLLSQDENHYTSVIYQLLINDCKHYGFS